MDAATLREILRKQYGITNEDEFNEAVKQSQGIDIGIFTTPIDKIQENDVTRISA